MRTVGLSRDKFDAQRTKLHFLLGKRLKDMKAEVERKSRVVAGDLAHALLVNTMPSEQSGIGKAIAHIKHDARNGLVTEGEAYEILEKAKGRRFAAEFYAAFKQGNFSRAESLLRKSGTSISGFEVGYPEKIDPWIIDYFKKRVISKSDMDTYLKKVVIRLGKTASGWAACLERLGFSGNLVRWKGTTIHGSDGGKVWVTHEKDKVTIWIANTRPLARKLINPSQVAQILKSRKHRLREWLKQPN